MCVTRKRHHHTGVEVHIVMRGCQVYELDGRLVSVEAGGFLLIAPLTRHRVAEEHVGTEKYSFTFAVQKGSAAERHLSALGAFVTGTTPETVTDGIRLICGERKRRALYGETVMCNRVLECILLLLRCFPVGTVPTPHGEDEGDLRVTLAKQYVSDNISRAISVSELAAYCRIGEKQLTRIFRRAEGIAVAEYIRRARCRRIEQLLADPTRTLCEISEEMDFANEYYFNTFFKKYAGMSPGAYRRSVLTAK